MIHCPGCRYLVPDSWTECKRCGARLPVPVGAAPVTAADRTMTPFGAPADPAPGPPPPPALPRPLGDPAQSPPTLAGHPGEPPADDFFVRADDFVRVRPPPPAPRAARRWIIPVVVVALAGAGLWLVLGGLGNAKDGDDATADPGSADSMTVLPPIGESGELPTVSDANRLRAEANLHGAMIPVLLVGSETGTFESATPEQLTASSPTFTYVAGTQASDEPNQISVSVPDPGSAILAVAAGEGRCAFARAASDFTVVYLTVATSAPCAAASAPTTGWDSGASTGSGGVPGLSGIPGYEDIPGLDQMPAGMDI